MHGQPHPAADDRHNGSRPALSESRSHQSPHMSSPELLQVTRSRETLPPHTQQFLLDTNMAMPPPSSTNSRPRSVTPRAPYRPTDRSLPSRDVTSENLLDGFVKFILYCNPNFPIDIDTSALRQAFESAPKSAGKDVDMFLLLQLVRKIDAGEKTWNESALDLGVTPPDVTKQESSQKLQQYASRLKRWLNALHVASYYNYLNDKPDPYYESEIPHPSEPYPKEMRAGIVPSEDLAIRALDPLFRPKRGRKRNGDYDHEETLSPGSRPLRASDTHLTSNAPLSAIPRSAHPDGFHDPWARSPMPPSTPISWSSARAGPLSAVNSNIPPNIRWQTNTSLQTPSTPHPMSAHIEAAFGDDVKSAVTPSSRKRKRHGPAVSSAWPAGGSAGAKPRGRPPANRTIQDGPFSTFPADPRTDVQNNYPPTKIERPVISTEQPPSSTVSTGRSPMSAHSEGGSVRQRLSLHTQNLTQSGPVVLVNGPQDVARRDDDHASDHRAAINGAAPKPSHSHYSGQNMLPTPQSGQASMLTPQSGHTLFTPQSGQSGHTGMFVPRNGQTSMLTPQSAQMSMPTPQSGLSQYSMTVHDIDSANSQPSRDAKKPSSSSSSSPDFEALKRVLASDLLFADITGRGKPLSGDEARLLAQRILERLLALQSDREEAAAPNDISCFTAATWLGLSHHLLSAAGGKEGPPVNTHNRRKEIKVTRFRTNANGYEEITCDETAVDVREVFDLSWTVSMGACLGSFTMKGLTLSSSGGGGGGPAAAAAEHLDSHDLIVEKALLAARYLNKDGWVDGAMQDIARATERVPADDNIDYKAKCRALEFGCKLAKRVAEQDREAMMQAVLAVLMQTSRHTNS